MNKRKRLKKNSKGQYTNNDGKVEEICKYIETMINEYVDHFSDVHIDDLELLLLHNELYYIAMKGLSN